MTYSIFIFVKKYLIVILLLPILGWPFIYKYKCNPIIEKPDTVIVIQNNGLCDLQVKSCEWELKPSGKFYLEISPRPIKVNSKQKAILRIENSYLIPLAIDFSGNEMEMGFNRPKFMKTENNVYTADFILEACASDEIKWKSLILFQSKEGEKFGVPFYFNVKKNN